MFHLATSAFSSPLSMIISRYFLSVVSPPIHTNYCLTYCFFTCFTLTQFPTHREQTSATNLRAFLALRILAFNPSHCDTLTLCQLSFTNEKTLYTQRQQTILANVRMTVSMDNLLININFLLDENDNLSYRNKTCWEHERHTN